MQLSAAGLELIKRSEVFATDLIWMWRGFRPSAYGHLLLPRESFPNGIEEAQATQILAGDVRAAEQSVQRW